MHIAVLIYGRINKSIDHYSNLIDSIGREHDIDFFLSSDNSNQTQLQDFINIYKPISYINDEIKYVCNFGKYSGLRPETNIHNMTCHFINKCRVFTLLENHIKNSNINYDVVISFRIDIFCYSNFNINNIENNTIYIPFGNDWDGINDQIAYGNVLTIKKYMNIFTTSFYLLETHKTIPHPEHLTLANINLYNLNICRFQLDYTIKR